MKEYKISIRQGDIFYYGLVGAVLFNYMLESSSIKNFNDSLLHDIALVFALISASLCVILRKYSLREFIYILTFNIVGILCFLSSGNTGLFMTGLAVTLIPKNSLDKVLKFMLIEEFIIFIIVVTASQIGILSNDSLEIYKGSYTVSGKTLGFGHPNMLAAQASSLVLLYLCVKRNKLKTRDILVTLVVSTVIFYFSRGRTALLLDYFAIIMIAFRKNKIVEKIIYKFLPFAYMFVLIVVMICMGLFAQLGAQNRIVQVLNDTLFNGRIGLAYRSLIVYPITLFGKQIDTSIWNQWQYFSLDNGQVMILLEYGCIGFLAYFWIIQKCLKHIKREREIIFAITIFVFLIWSMYEGTMYFLGKNFALLFLGTTEFKSFSGKLKEKKEPE